MNNLKQIIGNNFFVVKKLYKIKHSYVYLMLLREIFALIPVMSSIILSKYVIDAFLSDSISIMRIFLFLSLILVMYFIMNVYNIYIRDVFLPKAQTEIEQSIQMELFTLLSKADLSSYDDENFYSKYIKAAQNIRKVILSTFDNMIEFLVALCAITSIGIYIVRLNLFLIVFSVVCVFLSVVLNNQKAKCRYKYNMDITEVNRKKSYAERLFLLPNYAKDMRNTDLPIYVEDFYNAEILKQKGINDTFAKKILPIDAMSSLLQISIMFVPKIYLILEIMAGSIAVSDFVALTTAAQFFSKYFEDLFSIVPKFVSNSCYINDYQVFVNKESLIECSVRKDKHKEINIESIEFCNVRFQYPFSVTDTLCDISFEVKGGEKIAIVGANGVGKTTITKLLTRLYDVSSGEIKINGRNIKSYNVADVRKSFCVVQQDYNLFDFSVWNNVFIDKCTPNNSFDTLSSSLEKVGLDISVIDENDAKETIMGREFSEKGLQLSGGQKQKLALARVFCTNASAIILDEINSSLDPMSERKILDNIFLEAKDKIIFIVSHKLSVMSYVDKIIYIENGKICEMGTHAQLMNLGGKYYQMFNLQKQKFDFD